jgi:hypothetical protein
MMPPQTASVGHRIASGKCGGTLTASSALADR